MENIRKYKLSDWFQVSHIYDLSKPDEMKGIVALHNIIPLAQDDEMRRYFNASEIWVYEKDHHISGFIGLNGNVISWLFVHPDNRRRGIAEKLLMKVIKDSEEALLLNITKSNHVALSLYLKLGFKVLAQFDGKMYGHIIPALRMKLDKSAEPLVSP